MANETPVPLPLPMWAVLFQAALPLSVDLFTSLMELFRQDSAGTPPTPDAWNELAVEWASVSNEQKAREAIARSGLK